MQNGPGQNGTVSVVFLLWHENPDDEDGKLLGVYSSHERASARIAEAVELPGFRRFPAGFIVESCEVDKDEWVSGFATMDADGRWVDDSDPPDSE